MDCVTHRNGQGDGSTGVVHWVAWVALTGAVLAQGCSTATAAGCGTGVLAGVLLAVASVEAADDPSVDAGDAVLGGALFGIASGCSAAGVAEAVANANRKGSRDREQPEYGTLSQPTAYVPPSQPRFPGLVSDRVVIDDVQLRWIGRPRDGMGRVNLRLIGYGDRSPLAGCRTAAIHLDGEVTNFALQYQVKADQGTIRHTAQLRTDIATARRIQQATRASLDLCGAEKRMTIPALDALRLFVTRFDAQAPAVPAVPAEAVATQETVEEVKPEAAPIGGDKLQTPGENAKLPSSPEPIPAAAPEASDQKSEASDQKPEASDQKSEAP